MTTAKTEKTTETTRTRKTNPVQWVVALPLNSAIIEALPAGVTKLIESDHPLSVCIGPEFDSIPDAKTWLTEKGLVDYDHDLHRVTLRDMQVEQKRSLVQRGLDLEQ